MTLDGRLEGSVDGCPIRGVASGHVFDLRVAPRLAGLRGLLRSRRAAAALRRTPRPLGVTVRLRVGFLPLGRLTL